MTGFSSAELLTAWERCATLSPVGRAVALVGLANPDSPQSLISAMPIGSRDREVLRLRVSMFGSELTGLVTCAGCGGTVELTIDADDLIASQPPLDGEKECELVLEWPSYQLRFRVPRSDDLLALAAAPVGTNPEHFLLARCLLWAEHDGSPLAASQLPADVREMIEERMSEQDPLADIQLTGDCPDCGNAWAAPFDVPGFVWSELADFASWLLHEVHVLASGYGWRESDILGLSPIRRRSYLDLISG